MPNPVLEYFRTSKEELEKVSWPSKEDTLRYSALIVVGSILAAIFFGALDFGLGRLVQAVITARSGQQQAAPTTEEPIQVTPGNIEAVDANGNKVDLNVKTVPVAPSN